jgi:hypothetical protein
MMTEPKTEPPRVGVNVTLMVQLVPNAMLPSQVLVSLKSALGTMLLTVTAEPELLVTVTFLAPLVVPTCCDEKAMLDGDIVTWPIPVPVRPTTWGLFVPE